MYFYDVNATSNFVANAPAVLGFDPFPRFADYIVRVATHAGSAVSAAGDTAPISRPGRARSSPPIG